MRKYILKRIGFMIPTVLLVILIIYFLLDLIPSSPGRIILGITATEEEVNDLNLKLGYYDPLLLRYFRYLGGILFHFDFGESYQSGLSVVSMIAPKFPTTFRLALGAMVFSSLIGIPVGVLQALRHNGVTDRLATVVSLLLSSVPSFFLGLLLILLFALKLRLLPSSGVGSWKNYVLPVLTLSLPCSAYISRLTRMTMLEVMDQDYMRTARAKGCSGFQIIFGHGLRNALIPVVTQVGMTFAAMMGGSVICEQVFGLPGVGGVILSAIHTKDVPVILGVSLLLAVLFMLIMLLVDLIYAFLDPRIAARYKGGR